MGTSSPWLICASTKPGNRTIIRRHKTGIFIYSPDNLRIEEAVHVKHFRNYRFPQESRLTESDQHLKRGKVISYIKHDNTKGKGSG
jgi:hypothetical protein